MQVKLFEIRDKATFIPMMAIKLAANSEADRYLLSRAGYGRSNELFNRYVLLAQINGDCGKITNDPYEWGGRTYPVAHQHIIDHWGELESGAVIDVEFILGESKSCKESERSEANG